jgi:chemotaxis protein CheZ
MKSDAYRPLVAELQAALDTGDDGAFDAAFERLRVARSAELMPQLRRLTATAQSALQRFREEARIDALAGHEVPDARKRLAHVVKLTDEAAHRTLDLVERSGPLVEQTAREAAELLEAWKVHGSRTMATASLWPERALNYLERSLEDADRVRTLLSEMLIAQGYQDITGQIIRGVIGLVGEIEAVLAQLVLLSNGEDSRGGALVKQPEARGWQQGMGPRVPGLSGQGATVDGQEDIDALLASVVGPR